MQTAKLKQTKRRLIGEYIAESDDQRASKRRTKQSGWNGDSATEPEIVRATSQMKQVAHYADSERETDAWPLANERPNTSGSEGDSILEAEDNCASCQTRHVAHCADGEPETGPCPEASERPTQSDQGGDLSIVTDSLRAVPGRTNNGRCEGDTPSETEHHVADICQRLMNANRIRRNFVKSQVGLNNRMISSVAIARAVEMDLDLNDEESRTKAFKYAKQTISQVKKGKTPADVPAVMVRLITNSLNGIEGYDVAIKDMDKSMTKLAKQLPVADWVLQKDQNGFGLLSLALVIGECGSLTPCDELEMEGYSSPGKLWKRMACIPFESKGVSRMGKQWRICHGLSDAEWSEYGYCPRRRSVAFNIGKNLLRQNFADDIEANLSDDNDDGAGSSLEADRNDGPYRRRYDEVKAAKLAANSEEWPRDRCHNHGMLLATKLLLKNLWIEWHKRTPSSKPVSEPFKSPGKAQ